MAMLSPPELLRRVPLFARLTVEQAERLGATLHKRRFRRGETIARQGAPIDPFYVLLNGRARLVRADRRGREVILATLQGGDLVGELGLVDGGPHDATCRAESITDALALDGAEVARCLHEAEGVGKVLLTRWATRLRAAEQQVESLALLDVHGRVARALRETARPGTHGLPEIAGRLSRQDLARRVGASREMVSRVMKDLHGRGLVETRPDGHLVLHVGLDELG